MGGGIDLARNALILGIVYMIVRAAYNVFLHPLRKYPGPLLHRMTTLTRTYYHLSGHLPFHVLDLHKRYGPVVRIAPNELVFSSPQAWRDIYGYKKAGEEEFPKYDMFYKVFGEHVAPSLINSDRDSHGILRRQMSHGFSDRSMREQEPIIGSYVDLLIYRLRSAIEKNSSQDLKAWYNYTTFDIIGDLSFGVDGGFGCLRDANYHPWVKLLTTTIFQTAIFQGLAWIGFRWLVAWFTGLSISAEQKHLAIVHEKVGQRMQGGERPDFLEGLLHNKDELKLDQGHLVQNASLLIAAGSETTATLLTGATFLLNANPEVLRKLEQEVRSTFRNDDEITLTSVSCLSYMLACINEGLRRYPPVAGGLPRTAPKGGAMVNGRFVPEGTIVSVIQWAANHDEKYWTEPHTFAPERWLGDPKYKDDQTDVMQSFSVGPRNCIGRNLAYAEMRLILAKIVFNFDMSLAEDSYGWLQDQKAYVLWEKPVLNIHLKPVVR
ncbi:cytochrome P450 [Nemania sp. FL0916]|nr:cytochrome P450 [Nemania sp. FL0916]